MSENWMRIRGGTVIDGSGRPPMPDTDVVVRGNRIVAVGNDVLAGTTVPPLDELPAVAADGLTVMPGLVDAHCHMSYGAGQSQEEIDMWTSHELKTLIAAANAERSSGLASRACPSPAGTTSSVWACGGHPAGTHPGPEDAVGRPVPDDEQRPHRLVPDLGRRARGQHRHPHEHDRRDEERNLPAGEERRRPHKLADSAYGQLQAFTGDELKCVAELTHQLNRKCTIHARASGEVSAAVEAGFDWIMHGNILDDESIGKLAESGTPLVPTLLLLANRSDWPELTGGSPQVVNGARRMLERSADTYHRAVAAGVQFAMGTDTGFSVTPYGEWHARELELLAIYAGLSPLEAITAGTRNGARMMGLEGELGEIKPGVPRRRDPRPRQPRRRSSRSHQQEEHRDGDQGWCCPILGGPGRQGVPRRSPALCLLPRRPDLRDGVRRRAGGELHDGAASVSDARDVVRDVTGQEAVVDTELESLSRRRAPGAPRCPRGGRNQQQGSP